MILLRYGRAIEYLGQRYRLEGALGSGGMADVCLAWDEHEEREVAIKVIKPDELDQRSLDRFLKEATQIARWQHPHILRVYGDVKFEVLDASQGCLVPYIVMEYAQGGDLHKRLHAGQPYPLNETLHVFSQICSAVAYAHDQGIIHRDIKPLNVLFRVLHDGSEQAVLSDFGLAVEVDATHFTFAGGGTLPYMAPEQLLGNAQPASDIFALGVMLYQLCTGRLPFRRTLQDLHRIGTGLDHEPPAPSSLNPMLPPALDDVILTALAQDPAQRFTHADLLWQSMLAAVGGQSQTRKRGRSQRSSGRPLEL
ncbi:MAG TPA: serine/threonine-protein kinase, partial [Ktedonobacteraceae bacterium]|nr:serine/threonine-protein kinase [Ktedonobacteraceae bacterium]